MGGYAWVTLATNDAYSLGALVLAHSLRRVGTKYELAVLVTPGVTNMMREKLAAVFSLVQEVNVLDSKDEANLALLARPELGITFTKLHCWRLTQYEKCVFVDADTLVVRNCDELFEREELSAAPDVGWPDCFNSGVFVFRPSQQTFASITTFAAAKGSFDGGDQGLLNMYFNDWSQKDISKHLPFIYNMCSTATYSYLPAFKQFGEDVRIIHFIGITKPWLQYFDTLTGIVQPPASSPHLQPLLQLWWNIFCEQVHPQLSPTMATSTLAPIWHDIIPIPFAPSLPRTPVYYDTNHETYSDAYTEPPPDFSEFKDPWENYCWQSNTFTDESQRKTSIEHVHYTNDNNQICEASNDHCAYKENMNNNYHNPPSEEHNQFHHINPNEYSAHTRSSEFHKNEENTSIVENRRLEEHAHLCFKDNYERNVSTEPQEHHWQTDQNVIHHIQHQHSSHEHTNEHQYVHHQHVHHQHEKEHQFECQHRINEDDQKFTRDNDRHMEPHNEREKPSHVNNNHDYHQYTHHIVQRQESNQQHYQQPDHNHEQQNQSHNHEQPNQSHIHEQQNQSHSHEQEHHSHEEQSYSHEQQRQCALEDHSCKENYCHNNVQQAIDTVQPNHDRTHNNILYKHKTHETVNVEQNNYFRNVDKQTDAQKLTSHPSSEPCTDLHNVATQSDLNITGHLDSSNAGLAGALAQMTLGEPRSAEQIALEEHMRKQSWEQGQIDYMGRDSFDNIWKKICETLSLAPPRQPSPPKTTSEDETTSEKTQDVEAAKVASTDLPAQSKGNDDVDSPAATTTTNLSETQSLICKIPKDDVSLQETCVKHDSSPSSAQSIDTLQLHTKDESVIVNVQSSSINEKTVQLDTVDLKAVSVDTDSKKEPSQLESETICEADAGLPITQTTKEICTKTTTNLPSVGQSSDQTMVVEKTIPTDTIQDIVTEKELGKEVIQEKEENVKMPVDVVQELSTGKDTELSSVSASEVMFTNPVPIQVAESVLQTEPKESVTQEAKLITEEVITSTVAPVQEAVVAFSETLVELTDRTELCDPTLLVSSNEPANVIEPSTTPSLSQNGGTVLNGSTIKLSESDSLAQSAIKHVVDEMKSPQEEVIQLQKTEMLSEQSKLSESVAPQQSPTAPEPTTETVEIKKDIEDRGTTSELEVGKLEELQEVKEGKGSDATSNVTSELKTEKLEEAQEVKEEKGSNITSELKTDKLEEIQKVKEEKGQDTMLDVTSELEKEKLEEAQEVKETTALLDASKTSLESEAAECPIRPTRTKELTIPATPTVTEPTPPTSPIAVSTQDVESQGKTVKKTMKKVVKKTTPSDSDSAERADIEGTEKKTAKKVVKKVVKKPKEGQDEVGESSSCTDKPKKTAKGTKKVTKPSQSLETDTSIPETPPPGSSDAPVPPKRKVKASTSTKPASTAQKPDTES